jgi:hypothetical protein
MMLDGCAAKPVVDVTYAGRSGFEGADAAFVEEGGSVDGIEA